MGHSQGGATVISCAKDCPRASAVVSLDPYLPPLAKVPDLGVLPEQKVFMTQTEFFEKEIAQQGGRSSSIKSKDVFEMFSKNCAKTPTLCYLKGHWHMNCLDYVLLMPVSHYLAAQKRMPHKDYVERYLMNAWLALEFLEKEKLTPIKAQDLLARLARVRQYCSKEWK